VKRAAQERNRTLQVWRRHLAGHAPGTAVCTCERQPGRFRKGQRLGGCGNSRCYLCHADKLLKRPTRQQRRADSSFNEWLRDG
jgi:hypothetical protein